MIDAIRTPVTGDHRNVQIPRTALRFALPNRIHRGLAEGHGREARRSAQPLLGAAIAGVDLPFVDFERNAGQRRYRVNHQERAVPMRHRRDLFDRLMNSGRGFGVNDRDELRFVRSLKGALHRFGIDYSTPFGFDTAHYGAMSLRAIGDSRAEGAIHSNDDLVALL